LARLGYVGIHCYGKYALVGLLFLFLSFWVEQLCVSGVWLGADPKKDTNKEMCLKEFGVRAQILLKITCQRLEIWGGGEGDLCDY
jgi:hypothetical protein